jgi:hypothetical protein
VVVLSVAVLECTSTVTAATVALGQRWITGHPPQYAAALARRGRSRVAVLKSMIPGQFVVKVVVTDAGRAGQVREVAQDHGEQR